MKIIQLVPTLSYGDAVSNDVIAMHEFLMCKGYETCIYAQNIDVRISNRLVKHYSKLPLMTTEDILFYHFSTGCESLTKLLYKLPCRRIMIYHNITPAHYFAEYSSGLAVLVDKGRTELRDLKDMFEFCIADSEYNKQDLVNEGYTCPIVVLPILIPFKDYEKKPENKILDRYENDGVTNILFTGRIAPNKRQEDVIAAFAYYHKYMNSQSRLFLVGSDSGMEKYSIRLKRYVKRLKLKEEVIFTGHIPFSHILAYYKLADVFLCMSDHEGFCVPLVEAMVFNIPILAFHAAAVPETLGNAGIVLNERRPEYVAGAINSVVGNKALHKKLTVLMQKRLDYFAYEKITERFGEILQVIIEKNSFEKMSGEVESEPPENVILKSVFLEGQKRNELEKQKVLPLPEFKEVPIPSDVVVFLKSDKHIGAFVKRRVKMVLRTVYHGIVFFSPSVAQSLREHVYRIWNHLLKNNSAIYEVLSPLIRGRAGLLIDVTQTTKTDAGTGIQRVVNNIFYKIYSGKEEKGRNVIAVRNNIGKLITSFEYIDRIEQLDSNKEEYSVDFMQGDNLLLLDSSWEYYKDFDNILKKAKKDNVCVFAVVYDMFPVQYPELFDSKLFVDIFCSWHNMILQNANTILCISKSTADVITCYYNKKQFKRDYPLNLYFFHMGADVPGGKQTARKEIQEFVEAGKTFLMVGTLEPRKGHMVALQAFRKVIQEKGQDCRLLIIGHNGWKNDEIKNQLALPEYEDKVLWVQDASDEELRWAYAHSDALIAASKDEGFGLPLVEAAHFGLPIICSDIPIFKEVTQGHADYFKVMDANDLARCMSEWLQTEKHPDSRNIRIYAWQESAQEILDIIDGKVEPYKILH